VICQWAVGWVAAHNFGIRLCFLWQFVGFLNGRPGDVKRTSDIGLRSGLSGMWRGMRSGGHRFGEVADGGACWVAVVMFVCLKEPVGGALRKPSE